MPLRLQMADDPVNPPHYNDLSPTPMAVIRAWSLGFSPGNAVKYIARAGRKDPTRTIEDLRKAVWYLLEEISALERAMARKPHEPKVIAFSWHPISGAPRDGTRFIARGGPEDKLGFGGFETWWGATSSYVAIPRHGWCTTFGDSEGEIYLWKPDEWRFMIEEVDI